MADNVSVKIEETRNEVEITELHNSVVVSEDDIQVQVSLLGLQGIPGSAVITGDGPPTISVGNVGDIYVDYNVPASLYGPKGEEGWDAEPFLILNTARRIHVQDVAATSWTINHNLGGFPSVTCVDSAGTAVFGQVNYISETQIVLSFSSPFSGKAYLT